MLDIITYMRDDVIELRDLITYMGSALDMPLHQPSVPVISIGPAPGAPSGRTGPAPVADPTGALAILGLAGGLSRDSYNRRLLVLAARVLPARVTLTVFEDLKAIPPFDQDDEAAAPEPVIRLRAGIAAAAAVLIATPEYNGSLPGQLKNALDWASRPYETNVLRGKPVAVIGATPSPGATAQANADARRILSRIGALPIDETLLLGRASKHLASDDPTVERGVLDQLAHVLSALSTATVDLAA